ncbi:MAG TPA: hypothetical protein VKB67_04440 [Rhizomicrobium sp.]|nr:hypothetical protein [Rhizomicrobium sp.]
MKLIAVASVLWCLAASASAAGLAEIQIPADAGGPAIAAMVWSPCAVPAKDIPIDGPLVVRGVRDCPVEGANLPLVILSHGLGGGNLSHHDTAEALADNGFIAVTLTHVLDSGRDLTNAMKPQSMVERPADVKRVLDYVLQSSPYRTAIDPRRIGFFGFSRGGFTGLVLAGATAEIPSSMESLNGGPSSQLRDPDRRIIAFVIADPLNVFPGKASLAQVTAPIQLWSSQLGGQGVTPKDVAAIAANLPATPEFHRVPNSTHLSFIFPCSPAMAKVAGDACVDPLGFDRAAFHRQLDEQIVAFFNKHLK